MNAPTKDTQRIHQLWQEKLDANVWNGWRALLAGWEIEGVKAPVDANTPFQGYYRMKGKAIAYWQENGTWKCLIGNQLIEEDRAIEQWPWTSRYPISREWYVAVAEKGEPWPDADERAAPASIGHNQSPEETEIDALKRQIEAANSGVSDYAIITDVLTKAKAQSLRSRLLELAAAVKKLHKKIKDPLWEQVKEIDNTYLPLAKDAEAHAKKVRDAMDVYDTEQLRKAQNAERAVQAERDKIDRETAEAARKANAEGAPPPPPTPVPEMPPAYQPATTKGAYGRAASTKIVKTVTEVTDWDKLFGFLKTHAELKELMLKLAQRAVDKNFDVPGIKVEDKVRNV